MVFDDNDIDAVEALLARVADAADDLEADVRKFASSTVPSSGKETWVMDSNSNNRNDNACSISPKKKRKCNKWNSSTNAAARRKKGGKLNNENVPGVGSYDPNYFVNRRSAMLGRIMPARRAKIQAPAKRKTARKRRMPLREPDRAFEATSRSKRIVGGLIQPPAKPDDNHPDKDTDIEGEFLYNPDVYTVLPRAPAFSFGKPPTAISSIEGNSSSADMHYDVDAATRAIERAPAGGKINPLLTKSKEANAESTKKDVRNPLHVHHADEHVYPRTKGGAWKRPLSQTEKPDDGDEDENAHRKRIIVSEKNSTAQRHRQGGTFKYAKPTEKTNVYRNFSEKRAKENTVLGPGAYGVPDQSVSSKFKRAKSASFGRAAAATRPRRRRRHPSSTRVGPGAYDTAAADAVTRTRTRGAAILPERKFEKKAKMIRIARTALEREEVSLNVKRRKCRDAARQDRHEEGRKRELYDTSDDDRVSYSTFSDDGERKWQSSDDESVLSDSERGLLSQKKRQTRRRTAAEAKQYIALRDHQRRKSKEKRAPAAYDVKHDLVEHRARSVVSMAAAVQSRKDTEKKKKEIDARIQSAALNKYDKILQRLGVDGFEDETDGLFTGAALPRDWSQNDKPAFRYVDPAALPPAAKKHQEEVEKDLQKRGPGTYASQRHDDWNEKKGLKEHAAAAENVRRATVSLRFAEETGDEDIVASAKRALRRARETLMVARTRQDMTRKPGREVVKVTKTTHQKIVVPFYDAYKFDEKASPGKYDVGDRFGDAVTGVVDFDKMGDGHVRDDEAETGPPAEGDILLLSPNGATTKGREAGAGGFTFSKLPRDVFRSGTEEENEKMELNPDIERFKYKQGGLVAFDKREGRSPEKEAAFEDGHILDLSAEASRRYLDPPVKVGVSMAKARGRDDGPKQTIEEVVYDTSRADKHVKKRMVFTAHMAANDDERFPEADPDRPHDHHDAEYDAAGAFDAIRAQGTLKGETVDMSKQSAARFKEPKVEKWKNAVYEPNQDVLTNRKRMRNVVHMNKMAERFDDEAVRTEGAVLDIDPLAGEEMMSRFKKLAVGVDMSKQQGRDVEKRRMEKRIAARPPTPSPRLIERGEAMLHQQDKAKRRNTMGVAWKKMTGREAKAEKDAKLDAYGDFLDLDPKTPLGKKKRVHGGGFSKAAKPNPSVAAAKRANAGNVVTISPKMHSWAEVKKGAANFSSTIPRDTGTVGRYAHLDMPSVGFTSPARVDVETKKDKFRKRVKGGMMQPPSAPSRMKQRREKAAMQLERARTDAMAEEMKLAKVKEKRARARQLKRIRSKK